MDPRNAMSLSGSPPYYMQREISASVSGQGPGTEPGFLFSPDDHFQTNMGSTSFGSTLQVDSSFTTSPHGVNVGAPAAVAVPEPLRRRRGRPRKYGPEGVASLGLSPSSSSSLSKLMPFQKRGRGRPAGSGRKQQQLAPLGAWLSGTAGMGFTPHVITVAVGEDITAKIMSFLQQVSRAICILSATGVISTVTLRQPSTSGGTLTYEGRFEILCLSGSYLHSDVGSSRGQTGGLSISLANPDGGVIGGGVGGVLIAASPVQMCMISR
ncbi:AT-hook motif nuclear-localized protein 9 isoform X2 [Daucus carota subsp. sativus]|uniref:AT-hook motif nuclear-localized protein 9 isoform X2 n=1 Tax=Daucus carota subsp. sativus TaxID=79200 RepID=UPI003082FAA9